jgi:oleandomycin transport system ATP-binding protein
MLGESGLDGVTGATVVPDESLLYVPILSDEQLTAVVGLLGAHGFGIAHIGTHLPSLDEVFLAITGHLAEEPKDDESTPERKPA